MIHACIDKLVDPILAAEAARIETPENDPLVIPGTYMGNTNVDARFSATILTGKKWENGRTLKIAFSKAFPAPVLEKVKQRFRTIEGFVNLTFVFVEDWGSADIRVANDLGGGSWSFIGTDNKTIDRSKPTMNFGWLEPKTADSEYDRTVIHEAFHMLGMPHEHQHPRNGIPWDKPKVYEYYMGPPNNWSKAQIDHNLFEKYSETVTQFTEFDRGSIMLYPIPNELTIGDFWVGRNTKPSARDIAFLAEQYPKPDAPAPTKPAPTGPKVMSRFDFAKAPIASLVQELTLTYNKVPFGRFLPGGKG